MADKVYLPFAETWTHSLTKTTTVNHKWVISNYSLHLVQLSDEYCLESSEFSSTGSDKFKWCLKLYPSSDKTENNNYVGLYLHFLESNVSKVKANVKLSFVDVNNARRYSHTSLRHYVPKGSWGYPDFVAKKILLEEANVLLPNDKLTIFCEIVILEKIVPISGKREPIHFKPSKSQIADDISLLFQTHDFSDVTLTIGDKDIPAHKMILIARSPVFLAMFKNDMKETKLSRVAINDVDYDVFMEMLHFFYTDKVPNLGKLAPQLLAAAEKYNVEGLKVMCAQTLHESLNIENAVDILILSDLHNVDQLKTVAINFICIYMKDIIATGALESLGHEFPDLMVEILRAIRMRNNSLESLTADVKNSLPSK